MMRSCIILGLVLAPLFAQAQDANYSKDDILKHFLQPSEAAEGKSEKSRTRAVNIGASGYSDDDHASNSSIVRSDADAFNLLITFEVDSDRLTEHAKSNLDQFIEALKTPEMSKLRFSVEGHTDATGPENYNLALSTRRANSVVRYLAENGIDQARLDSRGFGEAQPKASNPTDPDNRRVETRLILDQ